MVSIEDFEELSLLELEETAYALQIKYDPPLTENQRRKVMTGIKYLIDNKDLITEEYKINKRERERAGKPKKCHDKKEIFTQKDTRLMSDPQLIYLPTIVDGKIVFYCIDRDRDIVNQILRIGKHPYTTEDLTVAQIAILKKGRDSKYPQVDVDDFMKEMEKRIRGSEVVGIPLHILKASELEKKLREASEKGVEYDLDFILPFATDPTIEQYILFKTFFGSMSDMPEYDIQGQEITDRDLYASLLLQDLINYFNVQSVHVGGSYAPAVNMSKSIGDFMTFINQHLENADQLREVRDVIELHWEPQPKVVIIEDEDEEEYYDEEGEVEKERKYTRVTHEFANNAVVKTEEDYEGETIRAYRRYSNRKKDGEWKFWYQNGNQWYIEHWKDDKRNGELKKWYENGNQWYIEHWKDDEKDGELKDWYPNGNLSNIEYWRDGKKDGEWTEWYQNGNQRSIEYWRGGKKDGEWKTYRNNKLESVGHWKDGKKDGEWTEWYKNGELKSIHFWKDGKKDGEWKVLYYNGKLNIIQNWKDGKKDGEWKEWYKNGELKSIHFWKDGKKDGEWKTYRNNKLKSVATWKDGKEDGEWKTYRNNKLKSVATWKDGKKDGFLTRWDNDGRKIKEVRYIDGVKQGNGGVVNPYYQSDFIMVEGPGRHDKIMKKYGVWTVRNEQFWLVPKEHQAEIEKYMYSAPETQSEYIPGLDNLIVSETADCTDRRYRCPDDKICSIRRRYCMLNSTARLEARHLDMTIVKTPDGKKFVGKDEDLNKIREIYDLDEFEEDDEESEPEEDDEDGESEPEEDDEDGESEPEEIENAEVPQWSAQSGVSHPSRYGDSYEETAAAEPSEYSEADREIMEVLGSDDEEPPDDEESEVEEEPGDQGPEFIEIPEGEDEKDEEPEEYLSGEEVLEFEDDEEEGSIDYPSEDSSSEDPDGESQDSDGTIGSRGWSVNDAFNSALRGLQ